MQHIIPTFFKTYALSNEKTRVERRKMCAECVHLNKLDICEVCHCAMFLKIKFDEARCPLGKW